MKKKLMIFVDLQNLLYACLGRNNFKWEKDKLVNVLTSLQPSRELIDVCFYGSITPIDPNRLGDDRRYKKQQKFIASLQMKYKTYIKKTQKRTIKCDLCKGSFIRPIEKGIDVALATDLVVYGLTNDYDVAIVVSGDADLAPVIRKLRDRKPALRIEIAQFSEVIGYELRQVAHRFYPLEKFMDKIKM